MPARALTIASIAGLMKPAIFLAIVAITAGDRAQPNISASAAAARSRERNCPCHRYAAVAAALVRSPQHWHAFSIS